MMKRGLLVFALVGVTTFAIGITRDEDRTWVRVSSVNVGLSDVGPVVLLQAHNRALPIFVDPVVATSIQSGLGGPKPPRPLSHDLMETILLAYDAKVTKVSIALKDEVYHAELTIARGKKSSTFDSRSSDAIALAVRFDAPIFVRKDQLDSAGKHIPSPEERLL